MRRRISRSTSAGRTGDRAGAGGAAQELRSVTDWVAAWGEGEEERVARWLMARTGTALPGRAGEASVRPVDPWDRTAQVARATAAHDGPAAATSAPQVVSSPAVPPRSPAPDLVHAGAALEAEVAYLEEERRRLAVALTAERADAERVRSELTRAAGLLEKQIAGLEEERRRILAGAEAAVAAAERAASDERAARAALDAARHEARAVEAKHFEVWMALDREVATLAARRRRLRRLRRGHRLAPRPAR